MAQPAAALTDNVFYLQQAADLVARLTPGQYIHVNPPGYHNGIGPHLRHCLDHYELFTTGWQEGRVDYDQRPRCGEQARNPAAMLDWIQQQSESLKSITPADFPAPLRVKMDCGSEMTQPWSPSSVHRELQFLISHTVHHFALIAMILHDQDLPVPPGFGVAPSTLKFEAAQSACAR